ncbi:MAG: carbohydrate binding domain-containing protein [Verrucomicrobiota bacterium]
MKYRKSVLFVVATVLVAVSAMSAEPLLKNGAFEEGSKGWELPDPYKIKSFAGRNGTKALAYERKSADEYPLAHQMVGLEEGKRYTFSAWIKTDGVKDGTASVCVEFYKKDGSWDRGTYPIGIDGTTDWTLVESSVLAPPELGSARIALYLAKGGTGKAWFDDVKLVPDDQLRVNMFVLEPANERITPCDGRIRLRTYVEDDEPEIMGCLLSLSAGDIQREFKLPVTNGVISADLGTLPEGKAILDAKLFADGKEIAKDRFVLTVAPPVEKLPAGACMIDRRGRAIVDGKPYLPVGLYVRNIHTNEVDAIAQSPFNCLLPYRSMEARLDKSDTPSVETINAAMDYCHEKGIKILFCIKDFYPWLQDREPQRWMGFSGSDEVAESLVKEFRNHPALLAWYMNDEASEDKVGKLVDRRRMVNALDPFHPTWGVLYQFEVLPMYGGSTDLMGIDPYPLEEPGVEDMKRVDFSWDMADKTAMATWVVPQAFNFGVYKAPNDPAKFRKYRAPTEAEMRAHSILSAIRGAKGFVFYSYFDMDKPPLTKADRKEFWPQLSRVGKMLRDLEPFLLSDLEPIKPKLKLKKGDVQAMEFRDADGNVRLLVAGVGPGKSRAVVGTPSGKKLKSLYGRCRALGNGAFEFSGDGACADILASE